MKKSIKNNETGEKLKNFEINNSPKSKKKYFNKEI